MDDLPRKPSRRLKAIDRQIDENLRRVYDDTLHEALPDRFTQLLAQLKGSDAATKGASEDD